MISELPGRGSRTSGAGKGIPGEKGHGDLNRSMQHHQEATEPGGCDRCAGYADESGAQLNAESYGDGGSRDRD
jgi:hypothetical protein